MKKIIIIAAIFLTLLGSRCYADSQSLDYDVDGKGKTVHAHLIGTINNEEADIFDTRLEQIADLLPNGSSIYIDRHDGTLTHIRVIKNGRVIGDGASSVNKTKSGTDQIAEAMAKLKKNLQSHSKK